MSQKTPILELVKLEESSSLEFKSALQWDDIRCVKSKGLRYSVLKSIAGFLNSGSGTLVIGVNNDGVPCGIEKDFQFCK